MKTSEVDFQNEALVYLFVKFSELLSDAPHFSL